MKNYINALAVTLLLSAPAVTRAELVFAPSSDLFSGNVRVTQNPLGDWVNILVEYQASTDVFSMSGGFRTLDGAVFGQGEGQLDTTFLLPPGALVFPPSFDTAEELSVDGAAVLVGNLAVADEYTQLAQLVLRPGTSAEAFSQGGEGVQFANASGTVIGTISGSVTAVPEPSAMAGLGLALLGWVGVRYRRRRRLALA